MIIDIHTHIFPDSLAKRASDSLNASSGGIYEMSSDLTKAGLLRSMAKSGVSLSVIQPVVTKASQLKTLNEWAAGVQCDKILAFGGIYPHTDDYKRDIAFVASLGLKGLKFHAEYQDFTLDAPEMLRIYDYAFSKGLIIMQHAGFDPAARAPFKSSPQMFAHVVDELKGGVMIAAHLGGHAQWEDVERYLAGKNIYLDTSMGFEYYKEELFLRILKKHGADKLLFGSDSPWSFPEKELEHLKALSIPEKDKNAILYANAARLLKLHIL